MQSTPLTDAEMDAALATLPGWALEGSEIVRTYRFPAYLAGIEFVSHLAQTAEAMNHHPDLLVTWRKVTVRLSTHSAGGITSLDIDLARKADSLAAA